VIGSIRLSTHGKFENEQTDVDYIWYGRIWQKQLSYILISLDWQYSNDHFVRRQQELNSLNIYTSGEGFGEKLKRRIKNVLGPIYFSINLAVFEVINRSERTSRYCIHRCAFICGLLRIFSIPQWSFEYMQRLSKSFMYPWLAWF
jgi:hypothetical protein